jgi:carbon storage regulator CsrA
MLVLTRKLQEQIRIGNDIVITVLEFRGSSIRLGIEAPRDVRVMREELPRREITINLESNQVVADDHGVSSAENMLALEPTANTDVQVIELDRKRPVWSTGDQRRVVPAIARSPLASKLSSRRAANMPNSASGDQSTDPRPECDIFGQDHLAAAQKENNRSFSSAV